MSSLTLPLRELASTVRSKNAGVHHVTFDVLFRDRPAYLLAKASGALTRERMASLYGLEPDEIVACVFYDPGLAFKFTIRRRRPAGTPGEPDPFGSQLYPPLFEVQIPSGGAEGGS